MLHQKTNTFDNIYDYFNNEEEFEEDEEYINYEENSNIPWHMKLSAMNNKNCFNSNKNKVDNNEIFTELYSNSKNNNDDMLFCEERNYIQNNDNDVKGEQFKSFKALSFRPDNAENDGENYNNNNENDILNNQNKKENNNRNGDNNIIEKVETNNWQINSDNEENNGKQSKKEIIYNKIITGQCSFGNMNEASNRSTSINTNNLVENRQSSLFQENLEQEMLKPEYLINSDAFDQLENENTNEPLASASKNPDGLTQNNANDNCLDDNSCTRPILGNISNIICFNTRLITFYRCDNSLITLPFTLNGVDGTTTVFRVQNVSNNAVNVLLIQDNGDGTYAISPALEVTYLTNPSTTHEGVAALIQQDWGKVGISVKVETEDWNVFLEDRKAGNFDIAREGWIADFNDPINMLEMWVSYGGNNDMQLGKNPTAAAPDWTEYDELIQKIYAETDYAKRTELMHEAEDMLMSTYAVVPVYYYNHIYLQKTNVTGAYATTNQNLYFMYAKKSAE